MSAVRKWATSSPVGREDTCGQGGRAKPLSQGRLAWSPHRLHASRPATPRCPNSRGGLYRELCCCGFYNVSPTAPPWRSARETALCGDHVWADGAQSGVTPGQGPVWRTLPGSSAHVAGPCGLSRGRGALGNALLPVRPVSAPALRSGSVHVPRPLAPWSSCGCR